MKTIKIAAPMKLLSSLTLLSLTLMSPAFAEEDILIKDARAALSSENQTEAAVDKQRLVKRMTDAKSVFQKLLVAPDGGIPQRLLKNSDCVAVLPDVLKAAFVVGGEFGRGVMSCKTKTAVNTQGWSAPAFVELRAASFGWQIGGKSTDLVMFFVGEKAKQVLTSTKFTLGADIGITAGPVGRRAEGSLGDDLQGVYSYAQSEGIFAGLALNGAEIFSDSSANKTYYSLDKDAAEFVLNNIATSALPEEAKAFVMALPQ